LGGVSVYFVRDCYTRDKGFYVSWQSGSQQVAVMFAALVGVVLSSFYRRRKCCMGMARFAADRPGITVLVPAEAVTARDG